MNDAGVSVFASFISPLSSDRMMARKIVGEPFIETYVVTPLEECQERDPKGLYQKAVSGEIKNFTGVSAPYEAPMFPDNYVETDCSVGESFEFILSDLRKRGYDVGN
jgi:adenylylsulfate kinase-like enzyme